ncbi:MAG: entericidin [Pseudomonadota bacterium]
MKACIAALIALPLLAACNTISGIGADVEAAGKVVKETADDAAN